MSNEELADILMNTFCGIWLSLRATTTQEDLQMYKVQIMKGLVSNGLNDQDSIARGVNAVRTNGGHYPPSVPEFIQWCKPEHREQCHNILPRLNLPEATPEQRARLSLELSAAIKGIK